MSRPATPQPNRRARLGFGFFLLLLLLGYSLASSQTKPPSPPEDSLLFRDGEVLLSRGEREKALWRFKKLVEDYPGSGLLNEAKFGMAICYTQLKRPNDAIRILNELLSTFLAPPRMVRVLALLGDNYLEMKDSSNALKWYGKGLLVPNQSKDELKGKVKSILDTFDAEERLAEVESLYRGAYAGGYAKLRLAQLAKGKGDTFLARRLVTELEKEYQGMDYVQQARELSGPAQALEKGKYTIGVVLPLSGPYQVFGTRVLQAIQLALKGGTNHGLAQPLSLAVRDSKGNPKEAERAIEELVIRDRVIAILGPLLSLTVDQAAKKAQQLKVPLITLSQKEISQERGEFIFQNSLTPLAQVQALSSFALKDLELRTFAVFYPNSPYGIQYKNLFSQEISRKGGRVLGSVVYQEEQTDFSQEIKAFFRIRTAQDYDSRKKKMEEFKPELKVDGIFIPDTHDRVGLILSQLAYFDITEPIFLGTNAWNNPQLIAVAGSAAEGAIFTDCFSRKNSSPVITRFVEDFRKTYQREPETLEAIAYDGARLLAEILQKKAVSSPWQLREHLSRIEHFQGVSGLKGFDEKGKGIRNLSIMKVKDGQITQFSP